MLLSKMKLIDFIKWLNIIIVTLFKIESSN